VRAGVEQVWAPQESPDLFAGGVWGATNCTVNRAQRKPRQ
jgi:hypothetical protein